MERIGVLGGTFDPPHLGHLWLAEVAWQQLGLDQVLFMPAGRPTHKEQNHVTDAWHRLAMTRLAILRNDHFAADPLDIERSSPHYTATLLPLLKESYPGALLWLLVGSDSLAELPTWHHPESIIRQARLGVLPRCGVEIDWVSLWQSVPGVDAVTDILEGPTIDLSATEIRRRLEEGLSVRFLVPAAVLDYIADNNLYP